MKKKHSAFVFLSAVVAFSLLLLGCLFDYNQQVRLDNHEQAFATLRESALQQIAVFNTKVEGQYCILAALALSIGSQDSYSLESITDMLDTITSAGAFYRVGIIDADGMVYTSDGKHFQADDRPHFIKGMAGESAIEFVETSRIDTIPRIIVSVPVSYRNEVRAVVFGSFAVEDFANLLISESYNRESYSFVCDGNGTIIIGSNNANYLDSTKNILDLYGKASLGDGVTTDDILGDLKHGTGGTFSYRFEERHRYVTYLPLGVNDWMIFNVVPGEIIEKNLQAGTRAVMLLTTKLLLLCAAMMGVIIWNDRKKTAVIRMEQERYRIVEEFTDSVLFEGDFKRDTLVFNKNHVKVFGWEPTVTKMTDLLQPLPFIHGKDAEKFRALAERINSGELHVQGDVRVAGADGAFTWYRLESRTLFDAHGHPIRVVGKLESIDAQKREIQALKERSETDALTGMYNRAGLQRKVEHCLTKHADENHTFMLIDIDNFKQINDLYGHDVGDQVLVKIAELLSSLVRGSDFIGRLGGDELIAFVQKISTDSLARKKAQQICDGIAKLQIGSLHLRITCSIGVVISNFSDSFEKLYKHADIALYEAKAQGKNRFVVYGAQRAQEP